MHQVLQVAQAPALGQCLHLAFAILYSTDIRESGSPRIHRPDKAENGKKSLNKVRKKVWLHKKYHKIKQWHPTLAGGGPAAQVITCYRVRVPSPET